MPIYKIVVGPGLNQEKTIESVKYFLEKNGRSGGKSKTIRNSLCRGLKF